MFDEKLKILQFVLLILQVISAFMQIKQKLNYRTRDTEVHLILKT